MKTGVELVARDEVAAFERNSQPGECLSERFRRSRCRDNHGDGQDACGRHTFGQDAMQSAEIARAQESGATRSNHSPGGAASLRRSSCARSSIRSAPAAAAEASQALFMSDVVIAS